jgi:hypothetical protein
LRGTIGLTAALVAVSVGCSSPDIDRGALTGDERSAAVYEVVLDWLIADEPGIGGEEQADWVLFVATRSEQVIDIDVQGHVVAALEPAVEVRFVDDQTEAIDSEVEDQPVRDLGLLVGLGAVAPDGDTVDVYADLYRNANQIDAWQFTVSRVEGSWELTGPPAPTDVRLVPPGD